jgi:hypothetical protein
LKEIIEPLRDPVKNMQGDLVTKDGPLAEELARTKALGIRVAAGVARRGEGAGVGADEGENDDIVMADEERKVADVLNKR